VKNSVVKSPPNSNRQSVLAFINIENMEKNEIDIKNINEIDFNLQEYFVNEFIRLNLSILPLNQIREELVNNWDNYSDTKVNEIFANYAFEIALNHFKRHKNIQEIEMFLRIEKFDDEIIVKTTNKIKSLVYKANKNILIDFSKQYVPLVSVACFTVMLSQIRINPSNIEGILIMVVFWWFCGAGVYLFAKFMIKKGVRKNLGL
jgi:hypothetical protein